MWQLCRGGAKCIVCPLKDRRETSFTGTFSHAVIEVSHVPLPPALPAFEDGTWHKEKRGSLMEKHQVPSDNRLPLIPVGPQIWHPFPSCRIPSGFDYYSIVTYFDSIADCDFSVKEGVLGKNGEVILHEDSSSDSGIESLTDDEDDPCDYKPTTFTDLCKRAAKKSLARGELFLSSQRIGTVMDCKRGEHSFVKAQVHASMMSRVYIVNITLDQKGNICSASCCCKTAALERCGHIAAVLLCIWYHIKKDGYEAITTTGRQCYWKKATTVRDPGVAAMKEYSTKRKIGRRNKFDYRATRHQTKGPMPLSQLKTFHDELREHLPSSLFLHHLGPLFDEDVNYNVKSENLQAAAEAATEILDKIKRVCEGKTEPFEIPQTRGQATSDVWYEERKFRSTCSDCKTFLGLTKPRAKVNYLRRKVWGLDRFESEAMRLGKLYEDGARRRYAEFLRGICPQATIQERGLIINPKYPQLACSPDGIIQIPNYLEQDILFEAKFLSKAWVNPDEFEKHLTAKEAKRFYLRHNDDGLLDLKENHSYFYQIQMALDILNLKWCHLMVYSEGGYTIVPVKYDENFWREKRIQIIKRHREMLLPEFSLRRTLRFLEPICLIYHTHFLRQEEPTDDLF